MSYIYIIKADGLSMYKIGISREADIRLKSLQAGSPVKLSILKVVHCSDSRATEGFIHEKLSEYRTHNEWFNLDNDSLGIALQVLDDPDWYITPLAKMAQAFCEYMPMGEAIDKYIHKGASAKEKNQFAKLIPDVSDNKILKTKKFLEWKNKVFPPVEMPSHADEEKVERVRALFKGRMPWNGVLKEIWGASVQQGGYKIVQASRELEDILRYLVQ